MIEDETHVCKVVVWSALSYALRGAPAGVPRKVDLPDTWRDTGPWSVSRVGDCSHLGSDCHLIVIYMSVYFQVKRMLPNYFSFQT